MVLLDFLAIQLLNKSRKSAQSDFCEDPRAETQYLDEVELLCQQCALKAFGLEAAVWGVNVQCNVLAPRYVQTT